MTRKFFCCLPAILLFGVTQLAHAYTYTYKNKTDHRIRVNVRLYEEGDRVYEIEAQGSCQVSTHSLLKNWTVDLFLENSWRQVLELNCDMFPGDHPFSIYVKEIRGPDGALERKWIVENQ